MGDVLGGAKKKVRKAFFFGKKKQKTFAPGVWALAGLIVSQGELEFIAAMLAATLRAGDALLLSGPLGAGKSTFARALLRAACADPLLDVPSPTYTLVQTYDAPGLTLHHYDLWRLDGPDSLAELGWDDARVGVVLVEWPDRLGALAPDDALHIMLEPEGDLRFLTIEDRRKQSFFEKKDQKTFTTPQSKRPGAS